MLLTLQQLDNVLLSHWHVFVAITRRYESFPFRPKSQARQVCRAMDSTYPALINGVRNLGRETELFPKPINLEHEHGPTHYTKTGPSKSARAARSFCKGKELAHARITGLASSTTARRQSSAGSSNSGPSRASQARRSYQLKIPTRPDGKEPVYFVDQSSWACPLKGPSSPTTNKGKEPVRSASAPKQELVGATSASRFDTSPSLAAAAQNKVSATMPKPLVNAMIQRTVRLSGAMLQHLVCCYLILGPCRLVKGNKPNNSNKSADFTFAQHYLAVFSTRKRSLRPRCLQSAF